VTRRGLAPGDIGEVSFSTMDNSKVLARVRYRRYDGQEGRINRRGKTKSEARRLVMAAARERLEDRDTATTRLSPDSTVAEVAAYYFELQDERNVGNRPQYLNEEHKVASLYLLDTDFGRLTLRQLSTGAVSDEHRRIRTKGGPEGKGSPARAQHWVSLIRKVLDVAVEYNAAKDNAARTWKPPRRPKPKVAYTPKEGDVWELRKLVVAYRDRPNRKGPKPTPILLDLMDVIAGTGLRIGEALGLRWQDIDLDADPPYLRVVGTVIEGHGVRKHWQPEPKTLSSARGIPIPDYLVRTLRRRKVEAELGEHTFVFETSAGQPVGPHQARLQLTKVRKWVATNPYLGTINEQLAMHALRRMVTTDVSENVDVVAGARVAGHSQADITEKFYWDKSGAMAPDVRDITQRLGRPYGDDEEDNI